MSSNAEVAALLFEIGEILTIKEDRFRSRAYLTAAQRVTALTEDIRAVKTRGELEKIPGVGKGIAATITEFLDTSESRILEELRESLPQGVRQLMELEGVGPRIAMRLNKELGIVSVDALEAAAKQGKIRELKGFGPKKEENLLQAITEHRNRQTRFLLGAVQPVIDEMLAWMRGSPAVQRAEIAGSARRRKETVGDLDLLVASDDPAAASQRFLSMPPVARIIAQGDTKSAVILRNHLQVDLRVIPRASYGAALQYFTGSKEHNVKLRTLGVRAGFKLNEYGLFRREDDGLVESENEEVIYRSLGMDYIPPELRENRGEIEAAMEYKLPLLVEYREVQGDLHVHSNWSDGAHSIREMAEYAKQMGLKYIAVTDHSKTLGVAHGLDAERLREQAREVEQVNEELAPFRVFHGVECDILSDGTLDIDNDTLGTLDWVTASIHSGFKGDEEKMTERMLSAISNSHVRTIGHPTGRIIQKRTGYPLNLERIYDACAKQGVMLEINAFPDRLDLDDVNSRAAAEHGVKLTVGSDAHAANQLDFLRLGIDVARRAWVGPEKIANTLSADDVTRR